MAGITVLCAVLQSAVPVYAQTAPDAAAAQLQEQRRAAERERQQQEQLRADQQQRQDAATRQLVRRSDAAQPDLGARLPANESPCFTIERIRIDGVASSPIPDALLSGLRAALDRAIDPASGHPVADAHTGRCLGAQSISILLGRGQHHLVERGYVTSALLAPEQDLKSGELKLVVVPGRVHALRLQGAGDGWFGRPRLGALIPIAAGDLLNLRDLEQGLENLKRVPSAEADIRIVPAEGASEAGLSDLVVSYQPGRPIRLNLSLDDGGSRSTGKLQGGATLSLDSPLGLGDLLYLGISHAIGGSGHGTRNLNAGYSVPWGYWLFNASTGRNSYHQNIAGASQTYRYSGDSTTAELGVSRIVYRDAQRKTRIGLDAWLRRSRNFIDDTEIAVQRRRVGGWVLRLNHRDRIGDASVELNLAYKRGTGAFGSLAAPEQAFGEGTSRFALISADANLSLPFRLGAQALRFNSQWRVQQHRTPLTPQDRFAIGGRYSVRGFDGEQNLAGESGWLTRNELAAALGDSGQELYLGIDAGQVRGPSSAQLLGRSLAGAVLGWRGAGSGWAQGLNWDLFVGTPLHKPDGFKTAPITGGFSLNWSY